jgi:HD-GYP domain-containing protein (c-di-GMP phosphodiesterase class II)
MNIGPLRLPATIACLTRAEARRDFGTNSHAKRVARIIQYVARQIGLSASESGQIASAAILHDIGKLAVPIDLLQKSAPLSAEEFALIKTHSQAGHDILAVPGNALMTMAATVALQHHEKYDGSGYPFGLVGEAISLPAQIAAICDSYDALRQDRPYRAA